MQLRAPRNGRPIFIVEGRSDDQEGNESKTSGNTCGGGQHLAAMAARSVDTSRAACRDQRGVKLGRIGVRAGQRCAGALGMGLELKDVSPVPTVNR